MLISKAKARKILRHQDAKKLTAAAWELIECIAEGVVAGPVNFPMDRDTTIVVTILACSAKNKS